MSYKVGLVGESFHRDEIRGARRGQRVEVLHELGNPHDALALVVVTESGDKLGHIPKDSWLRDAIHFEWKGCDATILSISEDTECVVIEVELNSDGVGECSY